MEALVRIQKELRVPKERYNRFGGFQYRNAEDILKAVKPLLKSGEILISTTELKMFGDDVYFGVTSTLRSGEHFASATAWAREEKDRPKMGPGQLSGAAESYAKKYSLGSLFMLDDGFDADHPTPDQAAHNAPFPEEPQDSGAQSSAVNPSTNTTPPPPTTAPPAAQQIPKGKFPAPSPDQRKWLSMLWDYFVANAEGRQLDKKKLMQLSQMHIARYPGSMNDVEQLKSWIKVDEL